MRRAAWVAGPLWDGAFVLSALWLVPLVLLLAARGGDLRTGPLDLLALGLTVPFWLGHRFSSVWLAYFTAAYRPLLRSQPVRFVAIPVALVLGCFVVILPPDGALPGSRADRLLLLAILDYLLVTWHFAAQHFGALRLYRFRAGGDRGATARRLDLAFAFGVGGLLVVLAEAVAGTVFFQDVWVDPWLPARWLAASAAQLRLGGTVLLVLATVVLIVGELRCGRPSLPRGLYVLGMAGLVGLALHATSPFLFVLAWTAQHWLLAVGLATRVGRGDPDPGRCRWLRAWHGVNRRPWALLLVLATCSALLLPFFEVEANAPEDPFYGDRLFGAFAEGLRQSAWVPALVALGFATAFLHYWLDRRVFRLRDPEVRKAAAGLLAATGGAAEGRSAAGLGGPGRVGFERAHVDA